MYGLGCELSADGFFAKMAFKYSGYNYKNEQARKIALHSDKQNRCMQTTNCCIYTAKPAIKANSVGQNRCVVAKLDCRNESEVRVS